MKKESSTRNFLVMVSMIFALFFGAGNLIFPLHLGQMAGHNWAQAAFGFCLTGVLLPLLALFGLARTHAHSMYEAFLPLGHKPALILLVLLQLTIGTIMGTPRTATVSYTVGIAPLLPHHCQQTGLLIFTAVYFVACFAVTYSESTFLNQVGKILNPLCLLLLFTVFFLAFKNPLGGLNHAAHAVYLRHALTGGFLEGYNTGDALGALAFGVAIINAIKSLHFKKTAETMATAGSTAMALIALIYVLLIMLGTMSLGRFRLSENGGVALSQVVRAYGGHVGQALLAALIITTCITTGMGLVSAFALDFHRHFPRLSYHGWLAVVCVISFWVATTGLDRIISWSRPLLNFLYPVAITIIILAVLSPYFAHDKIVYRVTVAFVLIPALLDLLATIPANWAWVHFFSQVRGLLPLAQVGLSWLIPGGIGLVIGWLYHLQKVRRA